MIAAVVLAVLFGLGVWLGWRAAKADNALGQIHASALRDSRVNDEAENGWVR
jgi:hypothetical protein